MKHAMYVICSAQYLAYWARSINVWFPLLLKSRVAFKFIIREVHITVRWGTKKKHMYVRYDTGISKNLEVMETSLKLSDAQKLLLSTFCLSSPYL